MTSGRTCASCIEINTRTCGDSSCGETRAVGNEEEGRAGPREERFETWYTQHYHRLRVLCARILKDDSAAEDAAQEALLRAWARQDQLRDEDVGAWLTVVARNHSLSLRRSLSRQVPADGALDLPDPEADPAVGFEHAHDARLVASAMSQLPSRHREALYLREIQELKPAELGERLKLSSNAVRQLLFRAREGLRERIIAAREGLPGVILQTRVKVRGFGDRARRWLRLDNGSCSYPALQALMNLALATGVLLAGPTAPDLANRPLDASSVQAIGRAVESQQSSSGARVSASVRLPGIQEGTTATWTWRRDVRLGPAGFSGGNDGGAADFLVSAGPVYVDYRWADEGYYWTFGIRDPYGRPDIIQMEQYLVTGPAPPPEEQDLLYRTADYASNAPCRLPISPCDPAERAAAQVTTLVDGVNAYVEELADPADDAVCTILNDDPEADPSNC
jgi:RNA polymerase sigma-70 factor, ECF subfamily